MIKNSKIDLFRDNPVFTSLNPKEQNFIRKKSTEFHLSFQNIKQVIDIASDLEMWEEGDITDIWDDKDNSGRKGKDRVKLIMNTLIKRWITIKNECKDYSTFIPETPSIPPYRFIEEKEETTLLGRCPVASDKTRCCNLQTLDAVKNCGFACSYCSIQSFYTEGKIIFQKNLADKLKKLSFDPEEVYHIGTGQSSDSLMWGNKDGLLDTIFDFAEQHPNIILELKTKSDNVAYFSDHKVPSNVLVTWSLNTDTIIETEEHLTASLNRRIAAARKVANRGLLVGFHFHPIVYYKNWESEYKEIFFRLQKLFTADEVALISLGTLTYIKPVIRELRKQKIKSKILQMPLEDANGKFSYPLGIKRLMFKTAYDSFSNEWKEKVFFYMCMEDKSLWTDVFGYSYSSNENFETDMKSRYLKKINELKSKRSIIYTGE